MAFFDEFIQKPTPKPVSSNSYGAKPCGKLKLRKAYFCSDLKYDWVNQDKTFKIMQGWVVIGLIGSVKDNYVIPKEYNGLPVIGIHYLAYETLNEYDQVTKEGCWKSGELETNVYFYTDYMHFVMPPRRYNNRRRVIVNYYVNTAVSGKNQAYLYSACSFCYDWKSKNLLSDIIRVMGAPFNYGYVYLGEEKTLNVKYKQYFSGLGAIYNQKESFSLKLQHSSGKTMKSGGYNSWDYLWDDSWVGKYYRYFFRHPNTGETVEYYSKDDMDRRSACLAFCYVPFFKHFAFNTITGTDVTISSDSAAFPGKYV